MDKYEYLKLAIKANAYYKLPWVISAFAITKDNNSDSYPYKLIQDPSGISFVDPSNNGTLTKLTNVKLGEPLFRFKEVVKANTELCINLSSEVETTIGILLTNLILLVNCFGSKIPYINGKFKISSVEDIIAKKLTTTIQDDTKKDPNLIYVDEYKKFINAVSYMEGFSQLSVWAASPKMLLPPPGIVEYRNKLLKENTGNIHDASVVASIEAKLVAYDAEFLKGDEAAETLGASTKIRTNVRRKLFLMVGGGESIVSTASVDPIFKSLDEGWEVDKFPQMNNSIRYGSYSRGYETQLGGVITKMLLRAGANIKMVENDCGTKLGLHRGITNDNYKLFDGSYIFENNKTILMTTELAKSYIGKTVVKRSPQYCKTPGSDLCKYCIGTRLSNSPNGIALAISDFGSSFLTASLKKMHQSNLSTAKLVLNSMLS